MWLFPLCLYICGYKKSYMPSEMWELQNSDQFSGALSLLLNEPYIRVRAVSLSTVFLFQLNSRLKSMNLFSLAMASSHSAFWKIGWSSMTDNKA